MNPKIFLTAIALLLLTTPLQAITPNTTAHSPTSGVTLTQTKNTLSLHWPIPNNQHASITLNTTGDDKPLIQSLAIAPSLTAKPTTILSDITPQLLLWVGSRDLSKPNNGWMIFFDRVNRRPYTNHLAKLTPTSFTVTSTGASTTVIITGLTVESFTGDFRITVYPNSPLIHTEAVITTQDDAKAILYDTGLSSPSLKSIAYLDNHDKFQRIPITNQPAKPIATRFRTVIAETSTGSIAAFPAPHQYLYPLDFADNFGFNFFGSNHQNKITPFTFGIRHPPEGDNRYVPWINAPPGTRQHLDAFYLLSSTPAEQTLDRVKRYTHADTFPPIEGYKTFSSHYHVEHTLDYLSRDVDPYTDPIPTDLKTPGFIKTFKKAGIDIVHLAEFHRGPTKKLNAAKRLQQLNLLHRECARLSDENFLLLPGEEPNVHLGGHWISFFPKPVDWVLNRPPGTPFVQTQPNGRKLYHVGSSDDVLKLMQLENGLMWTAHARIKSSTTFPDTYKSEPFFKSDRFLGAAFKSMPADLSRQTLGWRTLDLLDDMANWGDPKYLLGEVDVFKVFPDYELYGHMNINYLKIPSTTPLPNFKDGWQPVLDSLRTGAFFVTTGEITIPTFTLNKAESGQTLKRPKNNAATLTAKINWTFPLRFATIVTGDGQKIYRQRIDLTNTHEFGSRTISLPVNLKNKTWLRLEIWDIAANGAFTQPIWISP